MQVLHLKSWKCKWFPTSVILQWTPNNTRSGNCSGFVSFDGSLHRDLMVLVSEILRWIFMIELWDFLHVACCSENSLKFLKLIELLNDFFSLFYTQLFLEKLTDAVNDSSQKKKNAKEDFVSWERVKRYLMSLGI